MKQTIVVLALIHLCSSVTVYGLPTQWTVARGGNGHYYDYVESVGITWEAANTAAAASTFRSLQGHLATMTSAAETNFVNSVFGSAISGAAWLGGVQAANQSGPAAGWSWVTGEPWAYKNWGPGEPNDLTGDERFLVWRGRGGGTWSDDETATDPQFTSGFIIEYAVAPMKGVEIAPERTDAAPSADPSLHPDAAERQPAEDAAAPPDLASMDKETLVILARNQAKRIVDLEGETAQLYSKIAGDAVKIADARKEVNVQLARATELEAEVVKLKAIIDGDPKLKAKLTKQPGD